MNNTPPAPISSPAETAGPLDPVESGDGPFLMEGDSVPASAKAPLSNGTLPERIGDFAIVRILGEGGMGTVYLAEDTRLRRKAAIKIMKPEVAARQGNRERFLREAQAAAAIDHENIVAIWQTGESADGSPFIAMPFLQGEMLETRLKREPIQPIGIILKVAGEVAEGLAAAHANGLIHRDIKPGNVWIEGDPQSGELARQVRRCKILDFGLARSVGGDDTQITASGVILGTPAYMAPEQARCEGVDGRTDLFSLGVVLYRMSTGKMPFEGATAMAVLTALVSVTPPSAQSLNRSLLPALSDLIDRLLSKDPARRPQSAAKVAATIRQIAMDVQAVPAVPPSARMGLEDTVSVELEPAPRSGSKARRSRTPLLVALALLALVPLGWWLATVVLRVKSDKGTLVVEIEDDETESRIKGGKLILIGPDGKVRYTLSPGERDKEIDAGPYKIRVEGADGLTLYTSEFTLKKEGKVTVRVTVDPKARAKGRDPDREAAEWVLAVGGMVKVNDQDRGITAVADLSPEAFRLTWVDLHENKQVNDAGLANLKGCKNLTRLWLDGTKVSDAGLAHFKDCKNLTDLNLGGTKVSDAGLAYFKDCKNLTALALWGTQVSDTGLAYFKDCKNLTELFLNDTKVSDTGLAHLEGCKGLTQLYLRKTKVTAAKIEELKKAWPRCKIEWNGGAIEPTAK